MKLQPAFSLKKKNIKQNLVSISLNVKSQVALIYCIISPKCEILSRFLVFAHHLFLQGINYGGLNKFFLIDLQTSKQKTCIQMDVNKKMMDGL